MEWNAKLDWAEEIYTMLIVLPVPVIAVAVLCYLAPWLHRRRETRVRQPRPVHGETIIISGNTANERT